jgi:hypothetical protein
MDANYVLACGIVWRKTADPEAGWELAQALESPDSPPPIARAEPSD